MYNFLLNMWIMRKVNETYLHARVEQGQITENQKNKIMDTAQVPIQERSS